MLTTAQTVILGAIFFINMWYYRKLLVEADIKQRIYTSFENEFGDEIYKQRANSYRNKIMWYMILLPLMPLIAFPIYIFDVIKERKK